jgi:Amt family ammonium transporter
MAFVTGILASIVCFAAVKLKNKMGWDDALDVWGVHGVGGLLGTVLLGLMASKAINPNGADGLFFGGTDFFMKELIAVVGTSIYAFIFTYIMLVLINKITRVKVTAEEEEKGLDSSYHGETARDIE